MGVARLLPFDIYVLQYLCGEVLSLCDLIHSSLVQFCSDESVRARQLFFFFFYVVSSV